MKKHKSQKRLALLDENSRLIEERLPIKEMSIESAKEKINGSYIEI